VVSVSHNDIRITGDEAMFKKLATLPVLAFIVLFEPLEAIGQQVAAQPPQAYYGPDPWHYGWHFWWMFPAMILFFLLVCSAMFLFGHRLCAHGLHCSRPR
jgi:hypothetical protein